MKVDPLNPCEETICLGKVSYFGYWCDFDPLDYPMHRMLDELARRAGRVLRIAGPFARYRSLLERVAQNGAPFDFFITHESAPRLPTTLAQRQIGFWLEPTEPHVFRFPIWMLSFLNGAKVEERRAGLVASSRGLRSPLEASQGTAWWAKSNRACIIARNVRPQRSSLCDFVNKTLPLDRYGPGFGAPFNGGKATVAGQYRYFFCPENAIADGYVTEKIPDAYLAGCVPITWCEPAALAADFNPGAVLNLYGLSPEEARARLTALRDDPAESQSYLSTPLRLEPIDLSGLEAFIDASA